MNWIYLIIAGFCETGFAFCLGKGNVETGYKAALWYTAFAVLCLLSMILLTKATKTIPLKIGDNTVYVIEMVNDDNTASASQLKRRTVKKPSIFR